MSYTWTHRVSSYLVHYFLLLLQFYFFAIYLFLFLLLFIQEYISPFKILLNYCDIYLQTSSLYDANIIAEFKIARYHFFWQI